MSSSNLLHVLEALGHPKMLVLGDLILDRYTWGNAERISQEAPVIVLRADRREARLGGAANVANMLAGLEAPVACCGVVGDDMSGAELRQLLLAGGADQQLVLVDPQRPTSVKERFIGRASSRHPSQILRVDHEHIAPLPEYLEQQIVDRLSAELPRYGALFISDYGKGVCTQRVLKVVIARARAEGVKVMVDPSRGCPLSHYRGVTVIKPNRVETELATGRSIKTIPDALAAGRQLCQDLDAEMAIVTLDSDGMMLVNRDGTGEAFPTQARDVYDITGAGDMVMAMVGLCLADGTDPADAVRLGNLAAGLEVERAGVAVIHRDEIRAEILSGASGGARKIVTLQQAATLAEEHRRRGETVVFTNGCFDLLHVGHVTNLTEAATLGDALIVAVNSDASVRKLKGPSRPVIGESNRAALLAALACVRYVVIFDDDTPLALIDAIRPNVLVKGGTYTPDQIVGYDLVTSYGGRVHVTGIVDGVSTTNILASLAENETATRAEEPPKTIPTVRGGKKR